MVSKSSDKDRGAVQSMEVVSSHKLLTGYQNGCLVLYDFKSLEVIMEIDSAHRNKLDEGVTCISALKLDTENKD